MNRRMVILLALSVAARGVSQASNSRHGSHRPESARSLLPQVRAPGGRS